MVADRVRMRIHQRWLDHDQRYPSALSTHPAIFEKSTRGGEKISTSWFITGSEPADVYGWRRNHCQRRRRALLAIVGTPIAKIGCPGPADVMGECPAAPVALLEIVVEVGRKACDHAGRAPVATLIISVVQRHSLPNRPLGRDVQVIGAHAIAGLRRGPGHIGRNIGCACA